MDKMDTMDRMEWKFSVCVPSVFSLCSVRQSNNPKKISCLFVWFVVKKWGVSVNPRQVFSEKLQFLHAVFHCLHDPVFRRPHRGPCAVIAVIFPLQVQKTMYRI